jgi:NDP-sugar pyrophosphorylase family protein
MKPTLLVLAAGMGSRYGGLKQLDAMGPSGEVVLDYSVYDAMRAGFGKVVFVIRKEFETLFREKIGDRFKHQIQVEYAFQELTDLPNDYTLPEGRTKPWGTTHAVLAAANLIKEPFLMINADDFYGRDAFEKMSANLSAPRSTSGISQYSMVGFYLKNTLSDFGSVARGVCVANQGKLSQVTEMTKIFKTQSGAENREDGQPVQTLSGEEVVSMNFFGFTPDIFSQLNAAFLNFLSKNAADLKAECYVPKEVDVLIKSNTAEVTVVESSGRWFGVTYPEDKAEVVKEIAALVAKGEYPAKLWN